MWPRLTYILLGVTVAPIVKPILRGVFRQAVRGGILLGQEFEKVASDVKEEIQDVAAEELHTRPHRRRPEQQG